MRHRCSLDLVPDIADTDAVQLLQQARDLERQALEQDPPNADLLREAIGLKEAARVEIVRE